jgi:hypothetical protein
MGDGSTPLCLLNPHIEALALTDRAQPDEQVETLNDPMRVSGQDICLRETENGDDESPDHGHQDEDGIRTSASSKHREDPEGQNEQAAGDNVDWNQPIGIAAPDEQSQDDLDESGHPDGPVGDVG